MCINLVLLAKGTSFDIVADKGSKAGPPELGGNQLSGFQEAGVSGGFMIVASCQDGAAEGVIGRDIDAASISKNSGLNLPVGQPGAKWKRNVVVHGLESLKDKGVACRCRFNVVGEGGVNQVNKEGWWQEGDIGIVRVISGEKIRVAGEGVGTSKEFAGDMDHF